MSVDQLAAVSGVERRVLEGFELHVNDSLKLGDLAAICRGLSQFGPRFEMTDALDVAATLEKKAS